MVQIYRRRETLASPAAPRPVNTTPEINTPSPTFSVRIFSFGDGKGKFDHLIAS